MESKPFNPWQYRPVFSPPQRDSEAVRTAKDLFSGVIGGIGMCLSGHPLDTIKVRLVQQPDEFAGMMDCFRKTVAKEGFLGLYKGVQSPVVGMGLMNGSLFLFYGNSVAALKKFFQTDYLSVSQAALAGMFSGLGVAFVESPVDLFKCQLQIDSTGKYKGLLDVARTIYSNYGIRGVYQGLSGTFLRNAIGNSLYFGFYELFRRQFSSKEEILSGNVPFWKTFVAGGLAGQAFWTIGYPVDMIKTVMQADNVDKSKRTYSGVLDVVTKIFAKEGVAGFYRGFIPCAARAFPANATQFLLFETVRGWLGKN